MMDEETRDEINRRTRELRSALDRNAVSRRVFMLSSALHRMVEEYPRSVFPETWEVLDRAAAGFDLAAAASFVFDAEGVDLGKYTIVASFS